jgi:5'-3' exonuclease
MYRVLFEEMIKFIINLTGFHITPVWIWDGAAHPYKDKEKAKRRAERQVMIEERDMLKERLSSLPPFERDEDEVKRYQKLVGNTTYPPREVTMKLHRDMIKMGIPSIVAPYEGENYAASLAIQRKVALAWTADTDVLAIGCPIKSNGYTYENGKRLDAFDSVYLFGVLEDLEMSLDEFRDFCIMCGCDFNNRLCESYKIKKRKDNLSLFEDELLSMMNEDTFLNLTDIKEKITVPTKELKDTLKKMEKAGLIERLPGLGPAGCYKAIKKYNSIEGIGKERDIKCLNIKECREMLWVERISLPPDEVLNVAKGKDLTVYESQCDLVLSLESSLSDLRTPKDIGETV